jgi:MoxR-like ATPase
MPVNAEQVAWFADAFEKIVANIEVAILGKNRQVRLAVATLLAGGHLLLEDVPGTGKTVLAKSISATVEGTHSRIQFTSDLLPSDVTGVTIWDQGTQAFAFHPGPVFASIVLADEVNRGTPRTQSALLEVMSEGTVTVDGTQHHVGRPFMVIATQNPDEHIGTYDLPEAQLDRFMVRTRLGLPDEQQIVELLVSTGERSGRVRPVIRADAVATMGQLAAEAWFDPRVARYATHLLQDTHRRPEAVRGVSMRGALDLQRIARVWALADGRDHVTPDDLADLLIPVWSHRLFLQPEEEFAGLTSERLLERVLLDVPPPLG